MGISTVDGRAGTLVWVQRKNGSWWPGRIVGPYEISHEISPSLLFSLARTKTPIKLIGTHDDDSSTLNWHNLEKSKNIKAFRCGEFDEFIQKAEVYRASPHSVIGLKSAILHALELEKQQAITKKRKTTGGMNKSGNGLTETVFRAKRSKCIYSALESKNCSQQKAYLPQSVPVSSSAITTDGCSLHSGKPVCKKHEELDVAKNSATQNVSSSRDCNGTSSRFEETNTETALYEVNLSVQISHRGGKHVPFVSLMSRLNGKAITGHPIEIEPLKDGSSQAILPRNNGIITEFQAVWRTSKRTPVCYIDSESRGITKHEKSGPSKQKTEVLFGGNQRLGLSLSCVPVKQVLGKLLVAVGGLEC